MMRYVMKKKNVDSLPTLINQAIERKYQINRLYDEYGCHGYSERRT